MKKNAFLATIVINCCYLSPANAFEFEKNGLTGNFDTTLSWGVARRIQTQDPNLIGRSKPGGLAYSVNNDDGNVNYNKGLISNAIKVTHDLDLEYKNFGAFVRGSYFYDFHNSDKSELTKAAKDKVAKDADLLDAYVRGSFDIGGRPLDLRVGNQVVSWGESTFIQNSINVLNPIDVAKIRIPGAELREALLPVPMVWASQQLTDNITLEAVYLARFEHTEIDPRGTYFSTNDFASDGGEYIAVGFGAVPDVVCGTASPFSVNCVPRNADRDADDDGQFGLALRVFAPQLNDTEFGLFFAKYHSRLPIISAVATTTPGQPTAPMNGRYFIEYPEDIKLYGISFNTELSDSGVALQGEYSHRVDVPLQIEDVEILLSALCSPASQLATNPVLGCPAGPGGEIAGYRRHEVGQLQFTGTKVFGSVNPFNASQWVLLAEVGVTHVYDLPSKGTLRYEGPGTPLPGNALAAAGSGVPQQLDGWADETSWGYRFVTRLDYNSALGAATLSPRIAFAHDVNGTSPGPGGNFIEDRKAITLGLGINYLNQWTGDFSYTNFFGGGSFNQIHDRDFVAFNVKYSF